MSIGNMKVLNCPLCEAENVHFFVHDKKRDFFRCNQCSLIFVPPLQFISSEEEKAIYDLHENSPEHEGYRAFLSRLFVPMKKRLKEASFGLDFGSGPGPTLSVMFEEAGHSVELYDAFYATKPSVFERQYDFITATEVLEHLHNPKKEIERLWLCLKKNGILGIMTQFAREKERFAGWHYIKDYSHVCFYSAQTFRWLADVLQAELDFVDEGAVLLQKK